MFGVFKIATEQPDKAQNTAKVVFCTKEAALIQLLREAPNVPDKKVTIFDRDLDPRVFSSASVLQELKIFLSYPEHTIDVTTEKAVDDFNVEFHDFLNLLLKRPHKAQVRTTQHVLPSNFVLCGNNYYYQEGIGIMGVDDPEVSQNLRNRYAVLSENATPMQLPEAQELDSLQLIK